MVDLQQDILCSGTLRFSIDEERKRYLELLDGKLLLVTNIDACADQGWGRSESPTRLLEQLSRLHQQSVETANGQTLRGLTEMTPEAYHRIQLYKKGIHA